MNVYTTGTRVRVLEIDGHGQYAKATVAAGPMPEFRSDYVGWVLLDGCAASRNCPVLPPTLIALKYGDIIERLTNV